MNAMINKDRLRLYLMRHGEVEGAAAGMLLGRTDKPLSDRGMAQAQNLAAELSRRPLTAVYSSDLQRAKMTAEIIAKPANLKVEEYPAWREIDMGEWEGRTVAALHQQAEELIAHLFADPASFKYPGGESFSDFITRVQAALDQLLQTHDHGDVGLVAHGGVCRAIIGSALGMPMANWLRLAQDYGCLNVIEWYGGSPFLVSLNCSSQRAKN